MFFVLDSSEGLRGQFTQGYHWNYAYEVTQSFYVAVRDNPLISLDVVYVGF